MAEKTERVYDFTMANPTHNILSRVKSSLSWGPMVGLWALLFTIIEAAVLCIIDIFFPIGDIDVVRNFDNGEYNSDPCSYG